MYQYLIYNQKIESEFEISFALPTVFHESPDVTITIEKVPTWIKDKIKQGNVDELTEKRMWFYVPGKLIFFIEDGNKIKIERLPGLASDFELCSYLTGSGLALLLIQKGIIPIHGSMIEYKGKTIIVTGKSGSGKSTTVLEMLRRGCRFLSDDVSAAWVNEDHILALPAFPLQKLCRDTLIRYGIEESGLTYIDEFRDKFARKIDLKQYVSEPQELNCIIELAVGPQSTVTLNEMNGIQRLQMLSSNLYRGRVYEIMGVTQNRFELLIQIASKVRMFQIFRPEQGDYFEEVQELIWNKILQSC